jgi:hypothetical protein
MMYEIATNVSFSITNGRPACHKTQTYTQHQRLRPEMIEGTLPVLHRDPAVLVQSQDRSAVADIGAQPRRGEVGRPENVGDG